MIFPINEKGTPDGVPFSFCFYSPNFTSAAFAASALAAFIFLPLPVPSSSPLTMHPNVKTGSWSGPVRPISG